MDEEEAQSQKAVLEWIASGAPLFRTDPPDVPPMHLAVYTALLDGAQEAMLLGDHIKAGLWLPPGVHLASPVSRTSLSTTARRDEAAARVRGLRLGY